MNRSQFKKATAACDVLGIFWGFSTNAADTTRSIVIHDYLGEHEYSKFGDFVKYMRDNYLHSIIVSPWRRE